MITDCNSTQVKPTGWPYRILHLVSLLYLLLFLWPGAPALAQPDTVPPAPVTTLAAEVGSANSAERIMIAGLTTDQTDPFSPVMPVNSEARSFPFRSPVSQPTSMANSTPPTRAWGG